MRSSSAKPSVVSMSRPVKTFIFHWLVLSNLFIGLVLAVCGIALLTIDLKLSNGPPDQKYLIACGILLIVTAPLLFARAIVAAASFRRATNRTSSLFVRQVRKELALMIYGEGSETTMTEMGNLRVIKVKLIPLVIEERNMDKPSKFLSEPNLVEKTEQGSSNRIGADTKTLGMEKEDKDDSYDFLPTSSSVSKSSSVDLNTSAYKPTKYYNIAQKGRKSESERANTMITITTSKAKISERIRITEEVLQVSTKDKK
jgi:hypothetical protein